MVTPAEARAVADAAGRTFDGVAEPYPDFIEGEDGARYTFDWSLRREDGRCLFLEEGRCTVYGARPWICRTYPFYLVEGKLRCSECPGLGMRINEDAAQEVAGQLIFRHITEIEEAIALTKKYQDFQRGGYKEGSYCIIHDSEGEHIIPLFTALRS